MSSTAVMRRVAVGKALRNARYAAEMTLQEAGSALNPPVSVSYLSEVELGSRPCPTRRLAELVQLYKLDETKQRTLFVTARRLPPKTYKNILKSPETWIF